MNNELTSSTFLQILIILLLILITVIAFYYITKNYSPKSIETNAIERYFSTLSDVDMPQAMLANIYKANNIINGEAGFKHFFCTNTKINGKKFDATKSKRIISNYYTNSVDPSEIEHFKYLRDLKLTEPTRQNFANFRYRTVTAIFLEEIFAQETNFLRKTLKHSPCTIMPQKNIIHELITHTHQGGYFSFIDNITRKIFDSEETEQNYVTEINTACISIEVINSHTIKCKAKLEMLPAHDKANNSKKQTHKIKSSLTFIMSALPGNIYSHISYKNIKFKLDLPNTMKQLIKNGYPINRDIKSKLDPSKIMQQFTKNSSQVTRQETSNYAVLINKSKNSLLYQLPDFISPGLSHVSHKDQDIKYAVQHQR